MAIVFPVPIIPPDQYDAFRQAMGQDLADTYDKWLDVVHQQRGERLRQGETLVEIEVDYNQFMAFCTATGTAPNAKTLLDFVVKKSRG
jgi:hypothetical protein